MAILEQAGPGGNPGSYQAQRDAILRQTVEQHWQLQAGIARTEEQLAKLVMATGQQLTSIPGVDVVLTAELLAGIAPKEWGSAGKGSRTRSEHGRRGLHATFFPLAVALTSLMLVLVRVVWWMLKEQSGYSQRSEGGAA